MMITDNQGAHSTSKMEGRDERVSGIGASCQITSLMITNAKGLISPLESGANMAAMIDKAVALTS